MKHFILLILFGFFIVINAEVKVEEKQTLNEYKIEQLQKSIDELKKEIDELKKDVDDTKEKKLENKKDNESLDKRIGDINGSVDRFGIIVTFLGIVITILLVLGGFIGYRNAKADAKEVAKKEAEDTTQKWLEENGKNELDKIIQELQIKSEEEFSQLVNEKTNELNTLFENFKQKHEKQLDNHEKDLKQLKEQYTPKEKEEIEKEAKISQEKETKTFEDYWNIMLQYNANNEYDEILVVIEEVKKLENLTANQKGRLYFIMGNSYYYNEEYKEAEKYYLKAIEYGIYNALNNLGFLNFKQEDYKRAEECYLKAIEFGINEALFNLGLLYQEQKDYTKAKEYYLKAIESGDNNALNNLIDLCIK